MLNCKVYYNSTLKYMPVSLYIPVLTYVPNVLFVMASETCSIEPEKKKIKV